MFFKYLSYDRLWISPDSSTNNKEKSWERKEKLYVSSVTCDMLCFMCQMSHATSSNSPTLHNTLVNQEVSPPPSKKISKHQKKTNQTIQNISPSSS